MQKKERERERDDTSAMYALVGKGIAASICNPQANLKYGHCHNTDGPMQADGWAPAPTQGTPLMQDMTPSQTSGGQG